MKVTVLAENLRKGLGIAVKAVSTRSQLPVLSGVLLKAEKGNLVIMATDLEISFRVTLGAKVSKEGEMVVPARLFLDLISGLPIGPVELVEEKQVLRIESGGVKAEIVGQGADEFPSLPRVKKLELSLPASSLRKCVDRVTVSAAKDDTRPVLSGVLWSFEEKGVKLIATDGYRLGMDEIKEVSGEVKKKKKLILPARALQELARVVDEEGVKKVEVGFDEDNQQVMFKVEDVEMVSRLIAGNFPAYEQIMPGEYRTRVIVEREELLEAVKRASLFAREGSNIVKFKVEKDGLLVEAESGQTGGSQTKLEGKVEGEEMTIAFNARYVVDYLGVVSSDEVILELVEELKPGVFKVEGEEFIQVVMPIRMQD